MELVSKPNATAAVWEHVGFKPNDRGEPLNLCEPVYRICCKTVETKCANTTNICLHLKHNHQMQFSQLQKKKKQIMGGLLPHDSHNNRGL